MEIAPPIESLLLRPGREHQLAQFFADLAAAGDKKYFNPHSGDLESLKMLAENPGKDLYFIFAQENSILAYGLLRGWNEGFAVPSLGVAVHPGARSKGIACFVLDYLEATARNRHAPAVRLRVRLDNPRAISLYERRGYSMHPDERDPKLLVGMKSLEAS